MTEILLSGIAIMIGLAILIILLRRKTTLDIKPQMKEVEDSLLLFETSLERMEKAIRDEFQRNRSESNEMAKNNREELQNPCVPLRINLPSS